MALAYVGKYTAKILQGKRKTVEAKKAIVILASQCINTENTS